VIFQESSPAALGESVLKRIYHYLNYQFEIQSIKFSALSLLLLVVVIVVAVGLSRYAQRVMKRRILPRTGLDAGLQYALLRVAHYLIITIGLLYSLKVGFGVDLTSVAVVFGFLSVGIGFGLQYIAADLVSGFILLFERPVRVNDRVKLEDNIEGRVENISLRSTIVITNENMAVIVPNSKLVQNRFINYSYGSQNVRLNIPVGVAYGSDLDKVSAALLEAASHVEEVLETPPPKVHFAGFGDSSLDFEIRVWINQPHQHPQIRSNVNFQIDRLFRKYEIEIPFPQRDLHLRSSAVRLTQNVTDAGDDLPRQ
jgi:small-conductance mechanosensitive channel